MAKADAGRDAAVGCRGTTAHQRGWPAAIGVARCAAGCAVSSHLEYGKLRLLAGTYDHCSDGCDSRLLCHARICLSAVHSGAGVSGTDFVATGRIA